MDPDKLNYLRLGMIYYVILVCSVCIHEWAHAFTADKLGDHLPRSQGRVSLNPLVHMDLLGTVIFPLLMIFGPMLSGMGTGIALIGWGKPVMVSLPNPKTRKRDDLLITIAGPFSNLCICLIVAVIGGLTGRTAPQFLELIHLIIILNTALFVFNLIPIPPLDGSHFLKHAVGMREETYMNFARWGFLILLIAINIPFIRGILNGMIGLVSSLFTQLMISIL